MDQSLTFSGPATIYINGNVTIDSDLTAYNNIPSNLTIYQLGSNRTFGDSKGNNVNIVANVGVKNDPCRLARIGGRTSSSGAEQGKEVSLP